MKSTLPQPIIPPARTEATLRSSLRALPRGAWILFLGTFLNKFGTFVVPFLTIYLTRQGYTLGDAGLAIGAYGAGNLVASPLGGYLADRIGRRHTIVLSMFLGALAMLLLSQARGLPLIMLFASLAGLTGELYRPAASALLADLVPAAQRVTAFSAFRLAFNAGWAFGPATAGFLAGQGFFWLFIGDAITSVLFGLVALFALPRDGKHSQTNASWSEALKVLRHDRRFHQVLFAGFAAVLVFHQMASTFGLHVTQAGLSAATYGAIISLNGVLVVFCELPLTTITRRFPARRVIAIGYVLVGVGFAAITYAHTIPTLILCVVIFTFGEMTATPIMSAYIADLAPGHMRGRYMGAYGLASATGLMLGPALGMKLFGLGAGALWFTCGALCVIAALIILRPVNLSTSTPKN